MVAVSGVGRYGKSCLQRSGDHLAPLQTKKPSSGEHIMPLQTKGYAEGTT